MSGIFILYGIIHPCSVLEVSKKGKSTSVIHIYSIYSFDVSPYLKGNKKIIFFTGLFKKKNLTLKL